jgi:hypothetical protein
MPRASKAFRPSRSKVGRDSAVKAGRTRIAPAA